MASAASARKPIAAPSLRASASSQPGSPASRATTAGAAAIVRSPEPGVRSARRSSASAAAVTGSPASSSGSEARVRRRTIWRKPKPLTAVRSNGCGRMASSAAAARGASRLVDARQVDPDRAGNVEQADRAGRRHRARHRQRAPRQAAAIDIEQRHRRGQRHPEQPAGKRDQPVRRLRHQLGPARRLQCIRSVRGEDGHACAGRGDARRERRSRLHALVLGGEAQRGGAEPPLLGDRLAHDRDAHPRTLRDARRPMVEQRLAAVAEPDQRPSRVGQRADQPPRQHRSCAQRAGPLDPRLDDRAILDQRRPHLADAVLIEPLSQGSARPRRGARASRTAAVRPRPSGSPRGSGHTPPPGPGWHSRRPYRAIRRWRDTPR